MDHDGACLGCVCFLVLGFVALRGASEGASVVGLLMLACVTVVAAVSLYGLD